MPSIARRAPSSLVAALSLGAPLFVSAAASPVLAPDKWLETHLVDLIPFARASEPVGSAGPVESSQLEAFAREDAAPRSLYDMIKHRVGNFSFDYTDLAERHSEYFAEGMLEKRRTGTL